MDTATLSLLSPLPTQRFLSYEKPTPTCYVLPSHNHFLKHFSYTTNLNRNSKFRTPEAVLDTSPITPTALTTPTLRELCQAHTGSGKTLTYLLLINSIINAAKSSVQALVVVPTRELGMQVTKVARTLAAKPTGVVGEHKSCSIMALLDGGTLKRHKTWLKAEPPTVVVATVGSLCQMLERHTFSLETRDVVHIHVSAVEPMPSRLYHRFIRCETERKLETLLSLVQSDAPESGIIFVAEQDLVASIDHYLTSEKSKKSGKAPSASLLIDFLKTSYQGDLDVLLLEDKMNFNSRAASLLEVRKGGGYLLVATDIAARGFDLPEMSHIYNFDLPRTAIDYLHRAGRTCRKPFSDINCTVTSIIVPDERFVLQRYENELMFDCEELIIS
ncbi:hypothetical protein ACSQ67_006114 [Phaseolus vulgaris]